MDKREAWNGVGVEDGEALEGLKIDFGGVESGGLVRPVRPRDKLRARAKAHVGLENAVRVVQIRQDQIELGEVLGEVFGQFAAAREEARQRARFDGLNPIHQAAGQGQLRNVGVAEDFEVSRGELPAQGGYRRQSQDEVTYRSAANHQNPALE